MKICFFNTFEPVNTLYEDLVPALVRHGHEVTLIVSAAEYRQGRCVRQRYGDRHGVRLRRIPALGIAPRGVLRKLWVHLTYAVGAMFWSLFGDRADVNVFLTQPPFFGVWAAVLKIVRGQPYCCATMDLYPAALAIRTGMTERAWPIRFLNHLGRFYLQRAHSVLVLGRCMRARMRAMGVTRPIDVLPYWVNQHTVHPTALAANPMRADLGWSDRFVVYYGGNFGEAGRLDDLLLSADRLKDNEDILFVLMGSGMHERRLRDAIAALPGANVVMLPFLHDRYPLGVVLSASDVHFVSYGEAHTGVGVPTKAYAAMAAGRAFIFQGSPAGEVAMLIEEQRTGIHVREGDVDALTDAILQLHRSPDQRQAMGARGRRLAETTHSVEAGVAFYRERICSAKRP